VMYKEKEGCCFAQVSARRSLVCLYVGHAAMCKVIVLGKADTYNR